LPTQADTEVTATSPLAIDLGGLKMNNTDMVASGTFGYGQEYNRYFDIAQLGAVVTKSLSLKVRRGNKPPRLVETPAGLLNAIGLQNVGIDVYLAEKAPFLREKKAVIVGNIYGHNVDEFCELARRLDEAGAADAIEANLSCPNVHDARKSNGPAMVAQDSEAVLHYTKTIRSATKLPLFIKLTPNVMDIAGPSLAAEEGGADGVTLINTLLGMAIDWKTRRPKLSNIVGGLSGPAIRPVAVKMVWDAARALKIPVIGTGGICNTGDALEFLLAGARAVSVGSVTFRQPDAAMRIVEGLGEYVKHQKIAHINEIVGGVRVS